MNDLDPWKIWAITGMLALTILGSAEVRIRPQIGAEGVAQASTLPTSETSMPVPSETPQRADQYEAYAPGAQGSVRAADYSSASASYPAIGMHNVSTSLSDSVGDEESELDVTQQLFGTEASPTDALADTNYQSLNGVDVAFFSIPPMLLMKINWIGVHLQITWFTERFKMTRRSTQPTTSIHQPAKSCLPWINPAQETYR